jgi:hypothetical protein
VRLYLAIDRDDCRINRIDLSQVQSQQEPMMLGHSPAQCLLQGGLRSLHATVRQSSQPNWIGLAAGRLRATDGQMISADRDVIVLLGTFAAAASAISLALARAKA